jgi:hypothetical protein
MTAIERADLVAERGLVERDILETVSLLCPLLFRSDEESPAAGMVTRGGRLAARCEEDRARDPLIRRLRELNGRRVEIDELLVSRGGSEDAEKVKGFCDGLDG